MIFDRHVGIEGEGRGRHRGAGQGVGKPVLMCPFAITRI